MTAHTRIYGDNQLPTYPQNDCQDERFADTKEHQVAMTLQSLKSAAGCLYELSMHPEYRDIMIDDLGSLSDVLLALNLVWSRVKAREEA